MTEETRSQKATEPTFSRVRLRIATEADPTALPRILGLLQNLNLLPRRIVAESGSGEVVHVQIDFGGVTEERISLLTAKVSQGIHVLNAFWHHI
jgi:hypothetical protein